MTLKINQNEVLTPPVAAATVVVLRDSPQGVEVLLVKRHGKSQVLAGAHVFPGGKLDASDCQTDPEQLDQSGLAMQQALAESDLDTARASGLYVAALRETFEECDLLLHEGDRPDRIAALRSDLRGHLAQGLAYGQALRQMNLGPLQTRQLHPWARWITPRKPSMMDRRFDTRFFVAIAPAGQQACHDAHEITEALWLTPKQAIERYWDGQMNLAPVQLLTLMQVGRLPTAADVMRSARSRAPMHVLPEPHDVEGGRVLCYPGDPGHPVAQAAWEGPTRMIYRNGRFEPEGGLQALIGTLAR
ncbi:MAG: NUDIX hydrolase [Comamonadaceae bacterium]|jgi:8-oxo-dGTP pyrophosphatase MutT (NUDIX family)|nr:NUDIX hydrolase [Comamonadaceae bacterium]